MTEAIQEFTVYGGDGGIVAIVTASKDQKGITIARAQERFLDNNDVMALKAVIETAVAWANS